MSDKEIGYKKPPKNTQFKKGQSGNPAGRPKGSKNLKTILYEAMDEQISVKITGSEKVMSKKEAVIYKLLNDALQKPNGYKETSFLLNMLAGFESADEMKNSDYQFSHSDKDILANIMGFMENNNDNQGLEC